MRYWFYFVLVVGGAVIAFVLAGWLVGCQGVKHVASTLEVGVSQGRYEGHGDLADGDTSSVFASVRPLAALTPQEPELVYGPVWEPEIVSEPVPVAPTAWWRDSAVRDWIERLLLLIVGVLGGIWGPRGLRAIRNPNKDGTHE